MGRTAHLHAAALCVCKTPTELM